MDTSNVSQTRNFWIVTALVVCVLTFVSFQSSRVWMAFHLADFIKGLTPTVSQPYLLASGLFWAVAGMLVVWWLVRRRALALPALKVLAVLFSVNYWIEQLWLTRSELRSTNWAFSAGLNAVLLSLLFFILSLQVVRKIFGDRNGREPQN